MLHYWGSDGFYRIYPTSVPLTEEMTRRGRTSITLKRPDPDWRPTEAMLKRNAALPLFVPPGPDNPLGIRALNLGWPAYRIHGTNDIRKIGRQSSTAASGSSTSTSSRSTTARRWDAGSDDLRSRAGGFPPPGQPAPRLFSTRHPIDRAGRPSPGRASDPGGRRRVARHPLMLQRNRAAPRNVGRADSSEGGRVPLRSPDGGAGADSRPAHPHAPRNHIADSGVANLPTPVIYWRVPLSPIESTRESWLVFEALACPLAGPGELAVSQTRTL